MQAQLCVGRLGQQLKDPNNNDLTVHQVCANLDKSWHNLKNENKNENKEIRQLVDKNEGKMEGLLQTCNKAVQSVDFQQHISETEMKKDFANFNTLGAVLIQKLNNAETNIATPDPCCLRRATGFKTPGWNGFITISSCFLKIWSSWAPP